MKQMNLEYRIRSVSLNSFAINQFPAGGNENTISFDIKYSDEIPEDKKELVIDILINAFDENQPDVKLCTIQTSTSFDIINFEDLISEGEIPDLVIANFLGIALSTTRGILFSQSSIANSKPLIVPVISPIQLVQTAKNDQSPENILRQADKFVALHNFTKASELLLNALKEYPDYKMHILFNLGLVNTRQGNFDKAIKWFNEVIALSPKNVYAYVNRGHVNSLLGNHEEALKDANKALEIAPNDKGALLNKAVELLKLNKLDEAKEHLYFVLEVFPNSAEVYNGLAEVYKRLQDYSQAIDFAINSISLNNLYSLPYSTLAEIYAELGDIKLVLKYLSKALQLGYPKEEVLKDPSLKKVLHLKELQELINS